MKKNICFILDELLFGGIERVCINFLNGIDYSKYNVDVIILSRTEDMIKQIPKECNIILKNIPRSHNPLFRASTMNRRVGGAVMYYITFLLKKIFIQPIDYLKFKNIRNKYDTVIAFSGHLNDIYVAHYLLKSPKKIVWTHGIIYQYLLMSPAFEKLYSKFNYLITINDIDQSDIFYCKPYLNYNIKYLYNPVVVNETKVTKKEMNDKYGEYILSVGRLSEPKDFETLIYSYKLLLDETNSKINLVIVGDGPKLQELKEIITKLKLNDRVFLEGSQKDVSKYYKGAKIFVLSTKTEGFGMVIVEAMIHGCPCIATDAPYGPRDILKNDLYGKLVPIQNAEEMKNAIKSLLEDKEKYNFYKNQSLKRAKDFELENIMKKFYEII